MVLSGSCAHQPLLRRLPRRKRRSAKYPKWKSVARMELLARMRIAPTVVFFPRRVAALARNIWKLPPASARTCPLAHHEAVGANASPREESAKSPRPSDYFPSSASPGAVLLPPRDRERPRQPRGGFRECASTPAPTCAPYPPQSQNIAKVEARSEQRSGKMAEPMNVSLLRPPDEMVFLDFSIP